MLLSNLNLLATAPGGVARLRELILTLAVQGKLVAQDPSDEPASELLKKIRAEKDRLIADKKIRRLKPLDSIDDSECVFVLPSNWEWERLGNLGDWGAGATPSRSNSNYYGGSIPWFKSGELTADFISESEETVTDAALRDCSLRLNQVGDVLIAMYGATIGKTAILSVVGTTNQAVCACTPFVGLSNTYLLLLMKALKPYFISIGAGGAQPNISREKVVATVIGLPPLAEQSRIVTRVEELMRLCDALEAKGQLEATQHAQLVSTLLATLTESETPAQLADNWHRIATHFDLLLDRPEALDALEQTILQLAVRGLLVPQDPQDEPASVLLKKIRTEKDKLIAEGKSKRDKPLPPIAEDEQPFVLPQGWVWVRLNDLIRIGSGDGLTAAQMAPGGTIPVFGGNGVNGHHDKANVDEPTLVIGRVGYYCGSVHITPAKAWVTDNAFITRYPKVCLDMEWLYWLLVGTNLKENDSATAQPVISGRKLYPIVVALPPLAEQSRIVTRVAQLRRLCADLRQRLSDSQSTQAHLAEALVQEVA
ncbi:restriction endonuclease subunit S [Rhodoferax sp. TBRC 17660]|uniref:Restriction endonuclease subunit S n=1 Tax=Rhodoferax potami TaxID=3068338 RepID=A0ABU3KN60_9BURK|nr:restriction endonuclease subunit S [Rhodoferax sp. TBRC 17660]MDT7518961.1 restriction endonuclease subunit S [Rhodoferax sp. TBRC 17660]